MAKPKPALEIDAEFRKVLDRFGELELKYQQSKPWIKERETLKDLIRKRFNTAAPPSQGHRAEGHLYYVDLSPNEKKTIITDKPKCFAALKKAMGLGALMEALSYTLELVRKHVAADEQAKFLEEQLTGARDVTAVLKEAPRAA